MSRWQLDNIRTIQARVPAFPDVLANGDPVTSFTLATVLDGQVLPVSFKIQSIDIAHVSATDTAVSTISEVILYNSAAKEPKDKVYEDVWSDATAARENKYDATEMCFKNLDEAGVIYGTARIKSGATNAAVYITLTFTVD